MSSAVSDVAGGAGASRLEQLTGSRAGRVACWFVGAVLLALASWHVPTLTPVPSLDDAWRIALHMAASQGLNFGSDLVFTAGPLGFLSAPLLVATGTTLGSFAYVAVAQIALAFVVLRAATRTFGLLLGVLLAFLALGVPLLLSDLTVYVAFFACIWLLERDEPPPWWWLSALGGALAGFQLLVKLNGGVVCLLLFALAVWRLPPGRLRAEAILLGSFAGTIVILWLATGNPLGELPEWLSRSREVVVSYTDAMALELRSRRYEYVPAALLVAGAAALLVWHLRSRPARWVPLTAAALAYGFAYFKEGFVRHDAHDVHFFSALAIGLLAFHWRGRARWAAAALLIGVVLTIVQMPEFSLRALYWPVSSAQAAVTQTRDVADAGRRTRLIERDKAAIRRWLAVPPPFLRLVRGHTVDVVPLNTSAIWAYGLRWRPELLLQWYLAYDSRLDHLNAEGLAERGAERVLVSRCCVVDGKVPAFEAPETYLTLLCHYRELAADEHWEVLARTANRCGTPRHLATVRAHSGDTITIPSAPSPDEIVTARLDFPTPFLDRLKSVLFKPMRLPRVTMDSTADYRFIPAAGRGPLVLGLPASAGISPAFDGGRFFRTIQLRRVPSPYTIVFEAVPIHPVRARHG